MLPFVPLILIHPNGGKTLASFQADRIVAVLQATDEKGVVILGQCVAVIELVGKLIVEGNVGDVMTRIERAIQGVSKLSDPPQFGPKPPLSNN